jgi:hypothetical protein
VRQSQFTFLAFIILVVACACQPTQVMQDIPTLAALPSVTPAPLVAARPTQTPRAVATVIPTATETPRLTPTRWPANIMLTPGEGPPPGTLDPRLLTQVAQRVDVEAAPDTLLSPLGGENTTLVGTSVEGRRITARTFGTGSHVLLLAGGMHGGWEANTVTLVDELITHFEDSPQDVLPGMTIILIPVVNPDGLVRGRTPEGRFNANGVDLNRNWDCDWLDTAVWRQRRVDPGPTAFSEPETRALSGFIRQMRPDVALFYHSASGGIFAGGCRGDHGSAAMSAILGEATGYSYGKDFSAYPVSGTASNWADGLGIASADVELRSWTSSEFERNLRGIMALQLWLTGGGGV